MNTTIILTDMGDGDGLKMNIRPVDARGKLVAHMLFEALVGAGLRAGLSQRRVAAELRDYADLIESMPNDEYHAHLEPITPQ